MRTIVLYMIDFKYNLSDVIESKWIKRIMLIIALITFIHPTIPVGGENPFGGVSDTNISCDVNNTVKVYYDDEKKEVEKKEIKKDIDLSENNPCDDITIKQIKE